MRFRDDLRRPMRQTNQVHLSSISYGGAPFSLGGAHAPCAIQGGKSPRPPKLTASVVSASFSPKKFGRFFAVGKDLILKALWGSCRPPPPEPPNPLLTCSRQKGGAVFRGLEGDFCLARRRGLQIVS